MPFEFNLQRYNKTEMASVDKILAWLEDGKEIRNGGGLYKLNPVCPSPLSTA